MKEAVKEFRRARGSRLGEALRELQREALVVRLSLAVVVALAVAIRVVAGPVSWWRPEPAVAAALTAGAVLLVAIGARWLWLATMPPYVLGWRHARALALLDEEQRRLDIVELVTLRAMGGQTPEVALKEVVRGPLSSRESALGELSIDELIELSVLMEERLIARHVRHGGPRASALAPFALCILPAIALVFLI